VVHQGDAPVGMIGLRGINDLVHLPAAKQELATVRIPARNPGGVEARDVQALIADRNQALPPRKRLVLAKPGPVEGQIVRMTLEEHSPLDVVTKDGGDLPLVASGKQAVLNDAGDSVDLAAVHVVIPRDEEEAVEAKRAGPMHESRPKLFLQPRACQVVLLGSAGERQVAGDDHQVRRQTRSGLLRNEPCQVAQHRSRVPRIAGAEMDMGAALL
jgi:hypothetical protein